MDEADVYKYEARYNAAQSRYEYFSGSTWHAFVEREESITSWSPSGWNTAVRKVYELQPTESAPGGAKLWAAHPNNDYWPTVGEFSVYVSRIPATEPGTAGDPPLDMPRTLYRMLTASNADQVVDHGLAAYPLAWPLHFLVGSGTQTSLDKQQLIATPSGRIPFRYNEYPEDAQLYYLKYWNASVSNPLDVVVDPAARWIQGSGVGSLYHPAMSAAAPHFPEFRTANAQPATPAFLANCNNSSHWIFGRMSAFPGVKPTLALPLVSSAAGTIPWFGPGQGPFVSWLNNRHTSSPPGVSPHITGVRNLIGGVWGLLPAKQQWAVDRLRALLASGNVITEQELHSMINDTTDWTAYYLHRRTALYGSQSRNFFQQARAYLLSVVPPPQGQPLADLMDELDQWASAADLSFAGPYPPATPNAPTWRTPLKWHIFWYRFFEDPASPLRTANLVGLGLYEVVNEGHWPHPLGSSQVGPWKVNGTDMIGQAVLSAAQGTVGDSAVICPNWRLHDLLYVQVPFTGTTIGTRGSDHALKYLAYTNNWGAGWTTCLNPRRQVHFQGRMPMLVKLPMNGLGRQVWIMNKGIPTDLRNLSAALPEWAGSAGLGRFEAGLIKMAVPTLYNLPLTTTDLVNTQFVANPWSIVLQNNT